MKKKSRKTKIRMYEGLPVVDAKEPIEIHITRADVNLSKKNDPANCAAAVACKREYKKEVRIFLSRAYVKENDRWTRYVVPQRVTKEIISFDRGSDFTPGDYKVDVPVGTQKVGRHRGTGGASAQNKNIKRRPYHATANVREFDRTQIGNLK